jgi:gamma-glutamyltranspeptidase
LAELDLDKDIRANKLMTAMYLNADGSLVAEGATIKNPVLASTLDLLVSRETVMYHTDGQVGIDLTNELTHNVIFPTKYK